MAVEVVVNEDGSVTTRLVDEDGVKATEPEAKVVKAPAKKSAAARSTAEGK